MVSMKRKRSGTTYDEDEKLLHQATKALTKEAKRVRTFLLQQAIRKRRAVAEKQEKRGKQDPRVGSGAASEGEEEEEEENSVGERVDGDDDSVDDRSSSAGPAKDSTGESTVAAENIYLCKAFQPESVVKICLRRLGLRYTGLEGEEEVKIQGKAQEKQLVNQVVAHKRIVALVEELQERVTQRRRAKLAEKEGRQVQSKVSRSTKQGGRSSKGHPTREGIHGEGSWKVKGKTEGPVMTRCPSSKGSAFVSLSGEAPSDEEWAFALSTRGGPGKRTRSERTPTSSNRTPSSDRGNEPGWAGANRAAGWGRGGGRALRNSGGRGHQSKPPSHKEASHGDPRGRAGAGRGGGLSRGRGSGRASGRDGGARGGGRSISVGRGEQSGTGTNGNETIGNQGLHGSWAAKRALKEKEASATKAFSGTKIRFGDDD